MKSKQPVNPFFALGRTPQGVRGLKCYAKRWGEI